MGSDISAMERMWLTFLLIWCSGAGVFGQVGDKNPCNGPTPVQQEGCLIRTCRSGTVEESLAENCVQLIEEQVEKIVEAKLAEAGCSVNNEAVVSGATKYKTPGIIVAGGSWQTKVKLFKPDTKEVCNLPDIPEYFSYSSIDLVDGTPVMCGSWFGSPGKSHLKNETEKRSFFAVSSCVQLSPASKEAEWTIYTDKLSLKRDHVSMTTPDGILLMGGYDRRSVDLVKPDGSVKREVFNLERLIDRGCGIIDGDTIIITGGARGSNIVDRYNKEGFVENLPSMIESRTAHGCGYFNRDGKKVLVVGGGYEGKTSRKKSSTEIFTLGSIAWTTAAPLPQAIFAFASVSINDKIYFIVGDGKRRGASVLFYEFDGEKWEEIHKERYNRLDDRYRGNQAIAVDLATSGFDQFCN